MANEQKLAELAAVQAEFEELKAQPIPEDKEARGARFAKHREFYELIRRLEKEAYFSLELPEDLTLDGLSLKELYGLRGNLQRLELSAIKEPLENPVEEELRSAREKVLRLQLQELGRQIAIVRERDFNPGPDDAPGYEPEGYAPFPGFVKSNPANNDFYVEGFKNDPWYPAISEAHRQLTSLIPGYNIGQIKEKFGGLRYYIDYPAEYPANPENYDWKSPEQLRRQADAVIRWAEGWVDGYEAARREIRNEGVSSDD